MNNQKTSYKYIERLQDFKLKLRPEISFEFFPPKTDKIADLLWKTIEQLAPLNPNFVSVTYGAGGSTRERTHQTIKNILEKTQLNPASHLTCVGASRKELDKIIANYWDMGVKHIVALRGDLPEGYKKVSDGYEYAWQLVSGIKKIADFEVSVAGYPEMHPDSKNWQDEMDNLRRKVDAGVNRIITQFFFDNEKFFEFLDRTEKYQINVPIVPGILPITNFQQVVKFAKSCNTTIPQYLFDLFENVETNDTSKNLLAAYVAIEQCRILSSNDINAFHFYTLNRAELTLAICHILGIKSQK